MHKRRIGLDVGNVVVDRKNDGGLHSFFKGDHRHSPEIPGALEGIRKLRENGDEVYLISKVGGEFEEKTNDWFAFHNFYRFTGVRQDHVIYCPERFMKATYCEELHMTHFVDDRFTVHHHLAALCMKLYLFNPTEGDARMCRKCLPRVPHVFSWTELLEQHLFAPSLARV